MKIDTNLKKNIILHREKFNLLNIKINTDIDKNPMILIDSIFYITFNDNVKNESDKIKNILYLVFDYVRKHENLKFSDIQYIGHGSYMHVFSIGNKVIKIGDKGVETFHNNPYVVQPIIRKQVNIDKYKFYIEVTEKCIIPDNVGEEELYNLYKKLRDINLIWADIKKENIGILLKDNLIHWNEEIIVNDKFLVLNDYRGEEILKAGDYVILDLDYIYDEDVYNSMTVEQNLYIENNTYEYKFRKRYKKEKNFN